jgi:large subunit ribosomal protein L9
MDIEVLLMKDVPDLGQEGQVVRVKPGYARNYLLPRDLAAPVTEATRRRLAKMREERAADDAKRLQGARDLAGRLAAASVTIAVKTGEGEQMYGSVSAADIAENLKTQGIEIDRHQLELEHPLKELGVFDVPVRIHPDVEAAVKVWIVEE